MSTELMFTMDDLSPEMIRSYEKLLDSPVPHGRPALESFIDALYVAVGMKALSVDFTFDEAAPFRDVVPGEKITRLGFDTELQEYTVAGVPFSMDWHTHRHPRATFFYGATDESEYAWLRACVDERVSTSSTW